MRDKTFNDTKMKIMLATNRKVAIIGFTCLL